LAWFAVHLIRPPATFSPSDAEKEYPAGGSFLSPPNGERIEVRGFDISNGTTHPA
jgi:hypothetical protein